MKTCSDTCQPDCDFCKNYRDYYEVESDGEPTNTGFGLCLVRKEIMSFDWGGGCEYFYCLSAWRVDNAAMGADEMTQTLDKTKKISRRDLKSFASGTVNMFACSAVHFAWLAHYHGIAHVEIDLFTLSIQPEQFDIERNRILAGYCRDSLLRNINRLTPPAAVTSARLTADFGISIFKEDEYGICSVGKTVYILTLTDDRGKDWIATITDERVLAQD